MILDTIAAATKIRVGAAKKAIPFLDMRKNALELPRGNFRFEKALREPGVSVISEIKRASPSKGIITEDFPYIDIALEYEEAGASAISVLTEPDFFKGSNHYLSEIKEQVTIPLLRKDFVIDEYQLYEAKVIGADAVLLICALLDTKTMSQYIVICDSLGISALVEAHTAKEVESAIAAGARIIGINNRDLKTFEVNLNTCIVLSDLVPEGTVFVAESGIKSPEDISILREAGADAVLVGETLMRSSDKRVAIARLMGEG